MPPKSSSKKKSVATWYFCEQCEVHITANARETHDKVCPISTNTENVEYVHDGTLYTTSVERRTFNIDELSDMPAKYVNNLLYISEGAINLAKFHIGQSVVVQTTDNEERVLVRTIWPIAESFLTTAFATDADFQQNWCQFKGKPIRISALTENTVAYAKSVHLKLVSDESTNLEQIQLKQATALLRQQHKNLVYTNGSLLHLNFFNKHLQFHVLSWQHIAKEVQENEVNPNDLTESFEKLSLKQRLKYFKISNTTNFEIINTQPTQKNEGTIEQESQSNVTKSAIGGLDKQIALIEENMAHALGYKQLTQGVKISRGLLLFGATGCGKSMICDAMCSVVTNELASKPGKQAQIIKINSTELYSRYLGETEKNLAAYFERAFNHYPQPTLILLEDVHNLCPKHENSEVVKRVSVAFLSMLDQLSTRCEAQRLFLLATTSQIDALHPSIRRCGRLDTEIEVPAPTPTARIGILSCLLRKVPHTLNDADIEQVAQMTHGFVGADLANLVYTSSLAAFKTGDGKLTADDINTALTHVKPSAMREVLIENPNVRWADIGGQSELRLKLQQAIEWPLLHPEKFKRLGIKPPRGILMFGPPGCSKTMIAKALATESKLNFLSIKGPELFSMWVGESERAVREVFRKARQVAPAIVFFDEIDAIGGERADSAAGGSGASVKERVLTQLLTELDGVETLQNVTIVAATNRPDMIDKALLRPGRIDRIVYVRLPDAAARHEIFRIKLAAIPVADDVKVERLVDMTAGYSGAEIQAVCHEAALKTLEQSFDAEHVTWQQFTYALNAVQPRTSPELLELYEEYMKRS